MKLLFGSDANALDVRNLEGRRGLRLEANARAVHQHVRLFGSAICVGTVKNGECLQHVGSMTQPLATLKRADLPRLGACSASIEPR
jgi:hypothetical protein